MKFKINFSGYVRHLLACKMPSQVTLEEIKDWMILNEEDIANIRFFCHRPWLNAIA